MILIQDSVRNTVPKWVVNAVRGNYAHGIIFSPFSSPINGNGYKTDIDKAIERIRKVDGQIWFDPTTHALQMPQVGDFRYYADWDLWSGARGDLSTPAAMRDHVSRVFNIQREIGAPLLAPTILLHAAQSGTSSQAINLAQIAREEAAGEAVWLPIVGDAHFWSADGDLDAYIGVLDQLEPAGWMVSVARPQNVIPAGVVESEISGLMRSVYALSQDRPVYIGHGDLAGVPALAAGATAIGTGWDVRQRVLAYTDYALRADSDSGGQWYQRPTLRHLYGNLRYNDYQVLLDQEHQLAHRLTTGEFATGPENAFKHHARVLGDIEGWLSSMGPKNRVLQLRDAYERAQTQWPRIQAVTGVSIAATEWVDPLLAGVRQFISQEGW